MYTVKWRFIISELFNNGDSLLEQEVLQLYERNSEFLLRFARSMTPDRSSAQDTVQEVFFQYFVQRKSGIVVPDAKLWLFDQTKRILDRASVRLESAAPAPPEPDVFTPQEFSDALLDLEKRLPHLLSPRESEVLRMRAQGIRYADIARNLNITIGTVGTLVARAMRKLQTEFQPADKGAHVQLLEKNPKFSS